MAFKNRLRWWYAYVYVIYACALFLITFLINRSHSVTRATAYQVAAAVLVGYRNVYRYQWRDEINYWTPHSNVHRTREGFSLRLHCRRDDGVRVHAWRVRQLTGRINKKGVNEIDRDRGIRLYTRRTTVKYFWVKAAAPLIVVTIWLLCSNDTTLLPITTLCTWYC
jgi:hypothetical protein